MTQQFKKGDRVKVEFEATVTSVGDKLLGLEAVGGGDYRLAGKAEATLLERPVGPLAPGSVVRNPSGDTWVVHQKGVYFVSVLGNAWPASASATHLAGSVQAQPDHYTLLHDGSATT